MTLTLHAPNAPAESHPEGALGNLVRRLKEPPPAFSAGSSVLTIKLMF